MAFGCPVCNGFTTVTKACPRCKGELLEDRGTLEDFYGPYSPYEFQDFYEPPQAGVDAGCQCLHLLSCPACGHDERVGVCQIVL